MEPEIKQRIEQLNNGKIPKGYQKTNFGVFPSDWVTDKKLIDIGTFGKGKGIPGNKMQSDGVPCVGYGDIYMKYNHFHFEEAQSFVDEETAKDSQLIKKGTLLFTGTGETAEEIGKCVCYNGYSTICAGGDIITFVPQDVNPLFLAYQQYQNFSLKKKASFGQGHSVVHIQKESLEKLNVAYPESKNEQSRIVEILMKWDKAIELYDKQIDALTSYKAVCLKKMFPIKGQSVPEWRFQGFSGDWEQRKLNEITDVRDGTHDSPKYVQEGHPFITSKNVSNGFINYDDVQYVTDEDYEKINKRSKVDVHDILMGMIGTIGNLALISKKPDFAIKNVALIKYTGDIEYKYLYQALQADCVTSQLSTGMDGGTQKFVSLKKIRELDIPFPEECEQKKIGAYFSNLDTLITLHQRKKEVITNQRKTLQQYLLNGIVRVR